MTRARTAQTRPPWSWTEWHPRDTLSGIPFGYFQQENLWDRNTEEHKSLLCALLIGKWSANALCFIFSCKLPIPPRISHLYSKWRSSGGTLLPPNMDFIDIFNLKFVLVRQAPNLRLEWYFNVHFHLKSQKKIAFGGDLNLKVSPFSLHAVPWGRWRHHPSASPQHPALSGPPRRKAPPDHTPDHH